jgi:DNA-binding beta-propeller fold protein YncE
MDEQRFDAALRALNRATTRRTGFAAALGVLLGGAGLEASAKGGKPGKDRGKERDQDEDGAEHEGPCGDGSGPANRCSQHNHCCTRYCRWEEDAQTGRCRCRQRGDDCNDDRNCCGSLVCRSGKCKSKEADRCGPGNCRGCCTGGGSCLAGNAATACGAGGERCSVCSSDTPCCINGACSARVLKQRTTFGSGPGSGPGEFDTPSKIALTSDRRTAFITDSRNHRVQVWSRPDSTSAAWSYVTSFGSEGDGLGKFRFPSAIAVSTDGATAWVGHSEFNPQFRSRISVWKQASGIWTDQGTDIPDGGTPFNGVGAVRVNDAGNRMWVLELGNKCFRTLNLVGSNWQAGGTFGSDGSALNQFSYPEDLAVSSDGKTVYVADTRNDRVVVWQDSGGDNWAPEGVLGNWDDIDYGLVKPAGISVVEAPSGTVIYATDEKNSVWASSWYQFFGRFGGNEWLNAPKGIATTINATTRSIDEAIIVDSGNNRISVWRADCPS